MEQKRQIKNLKAVYTEIIKKLVNPTFKFSEGGATQKTLAKFLDLMEKEYGTVTEERLVDVCINIAYIYRNKLQPVKTMFGASSLKRFVQSKRGQRYYENEWLSEKEITRDDLLSIIANRKEHPLAEYIYMPSEEPRKFRLHNLRAGYAICQTSTLGWSPLSTACSTCDFAEQCKDATSQKYPELFRIRIEHGNR